MIAALRRWARRFKRQTLTVYFLARDPRLPTPLRLLALAVAAYALSPIDLIPDFVPVLGYLDDLLIVPLGLALILRLAPRPLVLDARRRARAVHGRPASRTAAVVIVLLWLLALGWVAWWAWRRAH
ncbi:YkvA family protein [Dyella sp.]|uniref:YkvA family protein n=1 Tax=Dyella sp. TaxID=1869338 RepID=UPI003F7FEBED